MILFWTLHYVSKPDLTKRIQTHDYFTNVGDCEQSRKIEDKAHPDRTYESAYVCYDETRTKGRITISRYDVKKESWCDEKKLSRVMTLENAGDRGLPAYAVSTNNIRDTLLYKIHIDIPPQQQKELTRKRWQFEKDHQRGEQDRSYEL